MTLPPLSKKQQQLSELVARSCRQRIIDMLVQSQSGHPGGSLSCIDYLALLYTQIISVSGEKIVISNGHISPAAYAILAEAGYISGKKLRDGFRQFGFPYEGHVTRHVKGVWYGTGPLGVGVSAATGFALAETYKSQKEPKKVFALVGDGESQEGQVYEMMNFAHKYKLHNLIVFMDYNQVQLSDGIKQIMPINPKKQWTAAGWQVIEVNGHDMQDMWHGLQAAYKETRRPTLLLGHTIMGKGVSFMEEQGKKRKATWHGKAPPKELATSWLTQNAITDKEKNLITSWRKNIQWKPKTPTVSPIGEKITLSIETPRLYEKETLTDCRSAYGNALLDIAQKNKQIIALTADLAESVKTQQVKEALPNQHIDCGVAEQQMLSCAGGLSLSGIIPFCSTFGVFMTSRAKDQARVNDINQTNVKMVATHCGLSVGEDGPTHQAIDDMGSFLGLLNTGIIEPADPNHCDRIIRYVASHYGNYYVRMGRHKIPVLTKENGEVFFDNTYVYTYGKCDLLRTGTDITIVASGPIVIEALRAQTALKEKHISAEIIIASSPKTFDATLFDSIQKTKRVITVEDHTTHSGIGAMLARELQLRSIRVESFSMLGVDAYQLSGTAEDLYMAAGIDAVGITNTVKQIMRT